MHIPTSLITNKDLFLNQWTIIELPELPHIGNGIDCHIYGWCHDTQLWHLSSKILNCENEFIETRSRKYYKGSPWNNIIEPIDITQIDLSHGINQLKQFLLVWDVDKDTIDTIVSKLYTL